MTTTGNVSSGVHWGSPQARGVLAATVCGSGMAMLDGTIVNIALPKIGADFTASVTGLQWVLDGYLLSLASLILVAGSLGDRYGRRRVFEIGVVWFGLASVLCGVAPTTGVLVAARVLQGIGGALLTPGSLAILQSAFAHDDRARAIGAWSGLGGVATAVGPLVGGLLIQAWSWRLAFLVNVPVAVLCIYLCRRYVPESRDPEMKGHPEVLGTVLCALGLAGVTGALVEGPSRGVTDPIVLVATVVGVLSLAGFCVLQLRQRDPLVPPDLFANRTFTVSNLLTFLLYAALGGVMMLMVMQLQVSMNYPPVLAGLAGLPITVIMLLGSAQSGKLAQRIGPRLQLIVGPILVGVGMLMLRWAVPGSSYLTGVLPGVVVFGLGLVIAVAPVTATVLAAAPDRHAGVASGVNNAVARTGSLLAVAVLPAAAGITGEKYADPAALTAGWQMALLICAIAAVLGGLIAFWVDNRVLGEPPTPAVVEDSPHPGDCLHCGVEGPPTHVVPHHSSTVD
ncbi:MFS transporter [Kutzneria kofuensis]|uniref:EmrB/QacA subfamily drug resistance transporter n=1 Tax=Kutzneria kofuensis TaxID=103725 RepID=A0A7W9NH39_9PSEU|nr:MFS transporter [Kutzneria kofuensis]MBB5892179.1 EmrB/QacA subfamily drug resistance transporter [Kutzneria kofuensis]